MTLNMIIQSTEALEESVTKLNSLIIQKKEYFYNNDAKNIELIEIEISKLKNYLFSLIIYIDKLIKKEKNERY